MALPTETEARAWLHEHVQDSYQRFHAEMVGAAMRGYGEQLGADAHLWWLTGYLHDIDYEEHPTEHPGPSLAWFAERGYPQELIDAIEGHAFGFNGFDRQPVTKLDKGLRACDEICGIFYAYQKLNPVRFSEMKVSSIKKRLKESKFAPGIDRQHIYNGVEDFGVTLDEHIENLTRFFATLPAPAMN